MPNYRVLKHYEVDERESLIAQVTAEVANCILHIRLPRQSFIEEVYNGGVVDFRRDEPILGLYHLNHVYVLKGLSDIDLVRVVSHEYRHGWQVQSGEYWDSFKLREYDAGLFSRELASYLGHPSESQIAARLITAYGMRKPISLYVRDLILNKGAWKNGVNKYQFES
jgi:hypothetical protein